MSLDPKRLVRVGVVAKAHGVRGELAIRPDQPGSATLLSVRRVLLRSAGGRERPSQITSARPAGRLVLVWLEGVAGRDQAQALSGSEVLLERGQLPDPEPGEVYLADLMGLRVEGVDGARLGEVVGILDAGAAPVLEVKGEREWQVPLADEFVKEIDLEAGRLVVDPPRQDEEA